MSLKLTVQIAKTHLLSRKKQTMVAAMGVTFGIAMFIAMVSFMTGVNRLLEDTMLSASPHLHIYNEVKSNRPSVLNGLLGLNQHIIIHHQKPKTEQLNLKNGLQMVTLIKQDKRVLGASANVNTQVFYNYGAMQLNGVIAGVNIFDEDRLFDISSKMKQGRIQDLLIGGNNIIMGSGLAKKLNVHKGDKVTITTPKGVLITLNVAGVFQMGIGAIDDVRSYASVALVQKILQQNKSYITDINIKLNNLYEAKAVADEYRRLFEYRVDDWETANANILVSFTLRNAITFATVLTILMVAGFGIYNIMNMTIYEKMKDIAILKATGFTAKDVMMIFITQALMIGLAGGILGLIIGFFMSLGISNIPFNSGGVLAVDKMPVNFDPLFYVYGISFGMITTILAGFFPSRKAGKIDPVDIIRG